MILLGIDPDLKGGLVVANVETREVLAVRSLPVTRPKPPSREKARVHAAGLWSALVEARRLGVQYVALEAALVRPQMGKGGKEVMMGSVHRVHQTYGAIRTLCELAFTPTRVITAWPSVWKKDMGIGGDKAKARIMAAELYPTHVSLFSKVKNTGLAEALLLTEWAKGQCI